MQSIKNKIKKLEEHFKQKEPITITICKRIITGRKENGEFEYYDEEPVVVNYPPLN